MALTTSAVLIPIGFSLGFEYLGIGDGLVGVRYGGEVFAISPDVYDVWWQVRHHGAAADLRAWMNREDIDAAVLTDLVKAGLVVEVDERGLDVFLSRHKLLPMGIGTGRDDPESSLYAIRDGSMEPLARIDEASYYLWSMSDGSRPLEDVCDMVASGTGLPYRALSEAAVTVVQEFLALNLAALDLA